MNEMNEMHDGQRVEVRLHSDPAWYPGTVIKARKMWVQIDAHADVDVDRYPGGEFIADENSIAEWRPIGEGQAFEDLIERLDQEQGREPPKFSWRGPVPFDRR